MKTGRPVSIGVIGVIGVLVSLVVIGVAAWLVQLVMGMSVIGTGQAVVWGSYIALFFVLAGAAGGLVVLAALGDLGVSPAFQAVRGRALLLALAAYVAAAFAILMDIGRPERVFGFLFSPNLGSMFVWDFYALALAVIVTAAYLYLGAKPKWLPTLAAVVATAMIVLEGCILAVTAGRPLWHSSLVPVVFLLEGLIVAASLVLLFFGGSSDTKEASSRLLKWLLPALLLTTVLELVTVSYGGDPGAAAAGSLLTSGSLAPIFWGQVLLGVILPWALLVAAGKNRAMVALAALLASVGVFAAKLALLVAGQSFPFLQGQAVYMPTLVEVGGLIGLVALVGLLCVIGSRVLPSKVGA
jgi:dimethyl sulfoxide reductase membrane subunit